jgi:hypothetical protein
MYPVGNRAPKEEYRNDEDLYRLLSLFGASVMFLLLSVILIVTAIFRVLRKIASLTDGSLQERSRQSVQMSEAP